jgi:hypothetical protein
MFPYEEMVGAALGGYKRRPPPLIHTPPPRSPTTSLEDVVLHSMAQALLRLVLRIGGEREGVGRKSAESLITLLQPCTSTDAGFLWYE